VTRGARAPAVWVQLTQALVARELVEGFGLPERRAADLLGLAPSAVSQYLSGHRRGGQMADLAGNERSRSLARQAAQRLAALPQSSAETLGIVLDTARELAEIAAPPARGSGSAGSPRAEMAPNRDVTRELHRRIQVEQAAVAECMRLAQKSRDELTRSVFRQIAADSLRHAEIVASIQTYLDRGIDRAFASGVAREDIVRLITRERDAEAQGPAASRTRFAGMMGVLWESMEADERKHEVLLDRMLASGFPEERRRRPAALRRPADGTGAPSPT
jgi:uncharacterized protein